MLKKTVIAAAALLAGVAAQAQVTVYGNVDLSIGRYETFTFDPTVPTAGFGDAETAVESGALRESFLGFKGQEDLGGGLKAFFALETSIDADEGGVNGNFWGRTSVLGLSGDFGTVTLGNARNLMFLANDAFNPFRADSFLFSTSQRVFSGTPGLILGLSSGVTGVDIVGFSGSNWTDSITYTSPNLSGFTVSVQAGLSEVDDVDNGYAIGLNYAAGPLGVNFTYETIELGAFDGTGALLGTSDAKSWLLSASYDFGAAKLFGQAGQRDLDLDEKYKFFQLGVSVPVSTAGAVMASYAQGKLDDFKSNEIALAYEHSISKRTSAYIGVNRATLDFGDEDDSGTSFAAGIRHSF